MNEKPHNDYGKAPWLIGLTFTIPLLQWAANLATGGARFSGLAVDAAIALAVGWWLWRDGSSAPWPAASGWRIFLYLGGAGALALTAASLVNPPVATITGQARTPFEVIDVAVFGPIAEELVFRGMMWRLFERLAGRANGATLALAGTSILFGVEHLGYWAQSGWPLPAFAYVHALAMIPAGAAFGFLRLKTKSLAVPAAAHCLANGIILLFQ